MSSSNWLSVEEAARICGTDVQQKKLGFSYRVIKACRELSILTTEHLLIHLKRYRFSRLYCVRNFGAQSGSEIFRWMYRNGLIDEDSGSRDFKVLYP